jgi:hypothetical protein
MKGERRSFVRNPFLLNLFREEQVEAIYAIRKLIGGDVRWKLMSSLVLLVEQGNCTKRDPAGLLLLSTHRPEAFEVNQVMFNVYIEGGTFIPNPLFSTVLVYSENVCSKGGP